MMDQISIYPKRNRAPADNHVRVPSWYVVHVIICVWQCGQTMLTGDSPKTMFTMIGVGGVMIVVVVGPTGCILGGGAW